MPPTTFYAEMNGMCKTWRHNSAGSVFLLASYPGPDWRSRPGYEAMFIHVHCAVLEAELAVLPESIE